jgi:hypothetical protein
LFNLKTALSFVNFTKIKVDRGLKGRHVGSYGQS